MQEFTTAVEEAATADAPIVFKIDGREVSAHRPADGQLAMYMASVGRGMTGNDMIAATVNFFTGLFDDDDKIYIEDRMLERRTNLTIEKVQEIMEWLIEQWSGHPTQQPSGSASSPPPVGQNSTPPTPALIL